MKSLRLLLPALLLAFSVNAQNCFWSSNQTPGTPLVVFNLSSTFPATTHYAVWNFGNGTTGYSASQGSVTAVYQMPGYYGVCASIIDSVTGNTVCTYCDTVTIGGTTNNCFYNASWVPGTNTTWAFSGSPAFSSSTLQWTFGDGTSATGNAPSHTYNSPGNYVVCMNEINPNGVTVCTYCDTINVTGSGPACQANFTYGQSGSTFSFIASATGTPPISYYWNFGNGITSTLPAVTLTYSTPGSYTVCLLITTATGCSDTICQMVTVPPSPNCQISIIPDTSQANSYYFQAVSNASMLNVFSWSFGDGTMGTGFATSHTYANPGTYTVCLTETSSNGTVVCSNCTTITVGGGGSNCQISVIPDTSQANSYYFQAVSNASMLNVFSWSFGDGTMGTGFATSHTYANPGTYTVCLTETSPNGTVVCSNCTTITVGGGGSNCTYTSSPIPGVPNAMVFNAPSVPGVLYNWNFGDGSATVVSSGNSVSHNFTQPGVYSVCLTLTQGANTVCTYCDSVAVSVGPNCTFSWTTAGPASPLSLLFAGPSYPNATYTWTWGDGTTTTTQGPSIIHTYAQGGTYQVCLNITANGAVICTGCQTITVSAGGTGCQADFVAVSVGLQAYFIDQSAVAPGAFTSYSWSFGDGNSSTLQFPNHQYSNPGWYGVCLTLTANNCVSVHCDSIYIDTAVVIPINCNAYFVFTQINPFQIIGVNLSSGINPTFSWDFGDGATSNQAYPSHQYTSTGAYQICLTVSDTSGCSSTYCDSLTVDSMGNIVYRGSVAGFILNILPPNQLSASIAEEQDILAGNPYPNPATDKLHIRLHEQVRGPVQVRIITVDGRLAGTEVLQQQQAVLDVKALPAGIYVLEMNSSEGGREHVRFIKE